MLSDAIVRELVGGVSGADDQRGAGGVDAGYAQFLMADPSEFVVNFDFAVEWLGFTQKGHAKSKMVKDLIEDVDYKTLLSDSRKQTLLHNLFDFNNEPAGRP